jgi:hypothetical protein
MDKSRRSHGKHNSGRKVLFLFRPFIVTPSSRHSFQEKITKLNLTVGQLYEPNDTLYSLVGDVGKDYGTRLQQAIALLSERDANCTDLQQRLLALELNRDDVREELEGRLSSLEERHSKALEEVVNRCRIKVV